MGHQKKFYKSSDHEHGSLTNGFVENRRDHGTRTKSDIKGIWINAKGFRSRECENEWDRRYEHRNPTCQSKVFDTIAFDSTWLFKSDDKSLYVLQISSHEMLAKIDQLFHHLNGVFNLKVNDVMYKGDIHSVHEWLYESLYSEAQA